MPSLGGVYPNCILQHSFKKLSMYKKMNVIFIKGLQNYINLSFKIVFEIPLMFH